MNIRAYEIEVACMITGLGGLKDVYEMLYPETKAGTARAIGMNKAKGNNMDRNLQFKRKSFIENTAGVAGSHPQHHRTAHQNCF